MKILHCIESLRSGGKERQLVELLKGMSAAREFETRVVILSEEVFYREIHSIPGLRVLSVPRKIRHDPLVFGKLWRHCAAWRPDVVMAWDSMAAVYALPAARLSGARFVNAMIQDAPAPLPRQRRLRAGLTFPLSHVILANSAAGLKAYGVESSRARVIRNGYDAARGRVLEEPEAVRRRFRITHPMVVGMVAEFRADKDQPTLIKAARLVLTERKDVAFVLAGGGERFAACRAAAGELAGKSVFFLGRVEANQIESVTNLFDVGVLATFTEGISNSIMEYMTLGKPVVATACDGTRELVLDQVTGFLVGRADPEALAGRILDLLEDGDLRRTMGALGRKRIEEEFGLDRMTGDFCRLFRELAQGRGRTRPVGASRAGTPC